MIEQPTEERKCRWARSESWVYVMLMFRPSRSALGPASYPIASGARNFDGFRRRRGSRADGVA